MENQTFMHLKINPQFEALIPPLSDEEFAQLEENILQEGIRDPLVTWHGVVIDGHNRHKIATKHNLLFQTVEMQFADEVEAMEWMDKNQIGRRNLSPDMMSYIRGRMYERIKKKEAFKGNQYTKSAGDQNDPQHNTAEKIAKQTGVSSPTIKRDAQYFKAVEAIAEATSTPGTHLIKENFATKKEIAILAGIAQESPEDAREIIAKVKAPQQAGSNNGKKITSSSTTVKTALRDLRKEQESEAAADIVIDQSKVDFRFGDFIDVFSDLPDGSIDLIITDPPYPYEYISEWSKLSAFAARVLKPSGFCIAYSGHMHLPEVMQRMGEHLDYYWTFCLLHSGFAQFLTPRNLYVNWKPMLIYQNGFSLFKPEKQQPFDVIDGAGKQKGSHVWQQNENELDMLIDYFSAPGDSILDPFAGSGSTLVKAIEMKRRALGAEIDQQHFNNAKKRIQDVIS